MGKKDKHVEQENSDKQEKSLESQDEMATIQATKATIPSSESEDKNHKTSVLVEKLKQAESDNLYLRAEFENFKKRTLEEKFKALRYEGEKFISSLATEVLDDLDRALSASKKNKSLEDLQKGLEIIHKKAGKLLGRFGVEVLDPSGKVFDPSYQEALNFVQDSRMPEDYVVETYKKAYKMHDKVIRPAQVIVAKNKK